MPPPSCTPAQRPREVGTELTNQPLNSGGSELRTPVQQPQGAVNTPRSRRPLSAASQQRRTERQAERRAEERTAELPMKEVKQIEALHDCSGASMHELASLIQHMREGPEKEQLRDLIEADIERYVHVPLEAKARCVRDYVKREQAAANMKVCAACGLRDPTESYESRNLRDLNLCADHWLHPGAGALARLRATRPMQLYRAGVAADTAPDVVVRRELLYNLSAFDGRDFHLVCYTCGKCRAAGLPDEGHTAQSRKCPRFGM